MIDYDPRGEAEIVWVVSRSDALKLPYVRETHTIGGNKKPNHRGLVAYAINAKNGYGDKRRIWYLARHDPYIGKGGPCEGVDPRTIKVNMPSAPMTSEQYERTGEFSNYEILKNPILKARCSPAKPTVSQPRRLRWMNWEPGQTPTPPCDVAADTNTAKLFSIEEVEMILWNVCSEFANRLRETGRIG